MKSQATTVADYFDGLPEDRRVALTKLRTLIRKAAPAAVESMQYGMAAFTTDEIVFGLASQKAHMALYVCDATDVVDAHRQQLGKLNCGKGCIRFRKLEDLPMPPGEGLRRSAGAWADDPQGLEEFLEWNRQQRKNGRRELDP
jgi:uncharacterized protein YdhG (YjbR/CyaY superfamily)